ncbi:DUF3179 domain-containing protein [bacterium]|nr:DUF3179 domain-containing protein [bacterium]
MNKNDPIRRTISLLLLVVGGVGATWLVARWITRPTPPPDLPIGSGLSIAPVPITGREERGSLTSMDTEPPGLLPGEEQLGEAGWPRIGAQFLVGQGEQWPFSAFPNGRFEYRSIKAGSFLGGGPGRDGIPSIDDPTYEDIPTATPRYSDRDPVAVLTIGNETRIYPQQILMWHEIANDTLGGIPVAVTYCPLCNATVAFKRTLDGVVLEFGVSGYLRNSDLIMYDRLTESWFQQLTGEGITGILTSARLDRLPVQVMSYKSAVSAYPDATVLAPEEELAKFYGKNPYRQYDSKETEPFLLNTPAGESYGDALPPKARILVVEEPGFETLPVIALTSIKKKGLIVHGQSLVVYVGSHASPLDNTVISEGRDVIQATVFTLPAEGKYKKKGSEIWGPHGARWDIFTGKPLTEGTPALRPARHGLYFWFAWSAFHPEATVLKTGWF